ncbi:hypothetical protein BaRGS_00007230 [Batillaria attramentaria]|uniref:Uncharacterized protein n=1 Tax=Batillaria attramentaria TaxID=370345 RepID=A0ABD0LQC0_9CAEN
MENGVPSEKVGACIDIHISSAGRNFSRLFPSVCHVGTGHTERISDETTCKQIEVYGHLSRGSVNGLGVCIAKPALSVVFLRAHMAVKGQTKLSNPKPVPDCGD